MERIRLVQLFGGYTGDVAVKTGRFEFHGLACGDYLIIAIGAKECLGTRTFRATTAAASADILLPDPPTAACTSAQK